MALGHSRRRHNSGNCSSSVSGHLGVAVRRPYNSNDRQGSPIYFGDLAKVAGPVGHQRLGHDIVPSAIQRHGRKVSQVGHVDIHRGGSVWGPLAHTRACFQAEQTKTKSATEQMELARLNVTAFMPSSLDLRRFKASPLITSTLRTAKFVFVRDDRLGKPSLAPRYT